MRSTSITSGPGDDTAGLGKNEVVLGRTLLETSAAVIYTVRLTEENPFHGTVELLNETIEQVTGYSAKAFTRSPELWSRLIHPDSDLFADG